MNQANIELFKNACAFSLTCRRMGNARRGKIEQVETEADKSRLKLTKQLIVSAEYDKIVTFESETYQYCKARTMPSFIKKGLDLIKITSVEDIDSYLSAQSIALRDFLVPELVKAYPAQVLQAAKDLKGQFDVTNYPRVDELPGLFRFEWDFLSFDVPDNLPEDKRKEQVAKLEAKCAEAQEQILNALRVAFSKLIDHGVDRLKVAPGEQPKTFQKKMLENIASFIETFSARNLMNDSALEGLVLSASRVLKGVSTEQLRESDGVREKVASKFEEIKGILDPMVVRKPSRKFDFED